MSTLPSSEKYTCPPLYTTIQDANVFCPSETIAHRHRPADDVPRSFLSSFMGVNDYREMPLATISPALLRVACPHDRTAFNFPAYPIVPQGTLLNSIAGHGVPEITIPTAGAAMFPAAFQGQDGCLQSNATVSSPFQVPFALQEAKARYNVIFNHDDLLVPARAEASSSEKRSPTYRSMAEGTSCPYLAPVDANADLWIDVQGPSSSSETIRVSRQGMRRDVQDWKDTKPSSSNPPTGVARAGAKRRLNLVDDPSTTSSPQAKKTKTSPKTTPTTITGSNGPLPETKRVNRRGMRWDLVDFKVDRAEKTPVAPTERVNRRGMRWDLLDYKADPVKTSSGSTSKGKMRSPEA